MHFIQEDSTGHGFDIIYSKDYDSKLSLGNTNSKKTLVKFPRNVEPGSIKIFDICKNHESKGSDLDG